MSTPFRLYLPRQFYEEMVAQARAELPNECCGLLAGHFPIHFGRRGDDHNTDGILALVIRAIRGLICFRRQPIVRVIHRYPLVNACASPTEYESEPKSLFDAARDMRRLGIDVVAVYHSHPTSDPVPSRKDRERNYSPDVVNFIISLKTGDPVMRGWWLTADSHCEAQWQLTEDKVPT